MRIELVLVLVLTATMSLAYAQEPQNPLVNNWHAFSVASGHASHSSGTQAYAHPVTAEYFNGFYSWMYIYDVSKFTHYKLNEFVCANYSKNCLISAAKNAFNDIYACRILNYEGQGGHFVVAVLVKPGQVFWNTDGDKIDWLGGWIIVDPQNDAILNDDLIKYGKQGIQENMTMFTPDGYSDVYWSGGGVVSYIAPECVVADFTIDENGKTVALKEYGFDTPTRLLDAEQGTPTKVT